MVQTTAKIVSGDAEGLKEAARLILSGRLVAFPTDTVYGLGCNPLDGDAVSKLVAAKQRQKGALPILINNMTNAKRLGEFNKTSLALAGKFWPGPLTLIVSLRAKLPTPVIDGSPYVGLRIPKHQTALNLIEESAGQIIGTSANISGHQSPHTAEEVFNQIGDRIDLILDGGPAPLNKESSVVKIFGSNVEVVREGAIPRDQILKALQTS